MNMAHGSRFGNEVLTTGEVQGWKKSVDKEWRLVNKPPFIGNFLFGRFPEAKSVELLAVESTFHCLGLTFLTSGLFNFLGLTF